MPTLKTQASRWPTRRPCAPMPMPPRRHGQSTDTITSHLAWPGRRVGGGHRHHAAPPGQRDVFGGVLVLREIARGRNSSNTITQGKTCEILWVHRDRRETNTQ
ncbi:hypothetical protein GQ607_009295 [Colletotrichum asianum]|uniref:Uncharacterized protein n=1 Tax=Colletotrichum asianum TaxID=702518 RepID=A0A8H3W8Q9_9PEZI|nr:hypothetical protein GQ607_009295 [Colletotrichum asianum]